MSRAAVAAVTVAQADVAGATAVADVAAIDVSTR
jgi:hypothetical protein